MAKLTFVTIILIISGVLTLVAICESATTVVPKVKPRSKVIIKKKKIVLTTTTPPTTTTDEPEIFESTLRYLSSEDPNDSQEYLPAEVLQERSSSNSGERLSSFPYTGTQKQSTATQRQSSYSVTAAERQRSSQNDDGTSTIPPTENIKSTAQFESTSMKGFHSKLSNCDECVPEDCETPPESLCPIGLIMDYCSCCFICASVEGNRCYNASLGLPYNPMLGMCGPGLTCQLRNDLEPYEHKEALCECGTKTTICGTDNRTYQSECKLREAAHMNNNLTVKNWHPCYSAPIIPAQVENVTVGTGEDVSLSCEVRAFPPPVIHWEFLAEDSNSQIVLPGDDSSLVVTIRGGPEQIMTTSWIQIVSVTPKRQGLYFCLAKNDEGMTQSFAAVSVYQNNN